MLKLQQPIGAETWIIQMEKCKNKLKIVKNHVGIWNVKMFKCQQPIGAETWIIQI